MTAKVTWFINASVQINPAGAGSNEAVAGGVTRIGGISESWYSPLAYRDDLLYTRATAYARNRAALLPNVCAVVAIRFEQVGEKGKVYMFEKAFAGSADTIADIPQMALRFNVHTDESGNERKYFLAAVPDARVSRGSYLPSQSYTQAIENHMVDISTYWQMRAVKKDGVTVDVVGVSSGGLMTLANPLVLVAGDKVQILRATVNADRKIGGVFKVKAVTDSTHYELSEYDLGQVTGGTARKYEYLYENVEVYPTDRQNPRATTRKFGRPFGGFVGRASKKR